MVWFEEAKKISVLRHYLKYLALVRIGRTTEANNPHFSGLIHAESYFLLVSQFDTHYGGGGGVEMKEGLLYTVI